MFFSKQILHKQFFFNEHSKCHFTWTKILINEFYPASDQINKEQMWTHWERQTEFSGPVSGLRNSNINVCVSNRTNAIW